LLGGLVGCASGDARTLHFDAIVVDTHVDTTQAMIEDPRFDLGVRRTSGGIDIPKMRAGGLGAVFFSIWMEGSVTGAEAVKRAVDQIDAVREQVRRHPEDMVLCTSADEVRAAHASGRIAALMGVEGGHMIANDLGVLRSFAALGVRYLTLTHGLDVDWADSSTDSARHDGLTDFGRDVVRELNRLGVMVDISHVSDKTFWDALEVSAAPLIASHSSCRALADAPRNMSDPMIAALAAHGGVIQINYHVGFLSQAYRDATRTKRALPEVDWSLIIDHIDHAVAVGGVDHVGLGSDWDGATMPVGMEDASQLPRISEALLARGYRPDDIRKILGGNTLRVMAEVEAVARREGQASVSRRRTVGR